MSSCIWDLEANKKTTDFEAHAGDVVSISLSPDGNTYVTGSVDKTCKLWDLREEKAKQIFFGHEADVNSVCVSFLDIFRVIACYPCRPIIVFHALHNSHFVLLIVSSLWASFRDGVRRQDGKAVGHQVRSTAGYVQTAELESRFHILRSVTERKIHILRQRRQFHSRMGRAEEST